MKNINLALLLLFAFAMSGYCETENYYDNILKSSSGDISKLEKISPDFSIRVFNDTNLNENQKYNISQRYRSLADGEYSEAFACDCFDFLKNTYVKNKTKEGRLFVLASIIGEKLQTFE